MELVNAIRGRKPSMTESEIEIARVMKSQGYSYADIEKRIGRSRSAIQRTLKGELVKRPKLNTEF